MRARDFALLVLICLTWAFHSIVAKAVVSGMEMPPLFYAALRYALVAFAAWPWLLPMPRPGWRLLAIALLMGGGGFALFFIGIRTASPSASAVVTLLGMPMTALLSVLMLRERIRPRRGIGIGLTFAGAMLVMLDPDGFSISTGLIFVAGSAFAGSLGAVMMKQMDKVAPMQFQAWVGFASVIPLALLSAVLEDEQLPRALQAGWPFVAAVVYSALVVSVFGHTAYYWLIQKYEGNLIAPLMLITPLLTIVFGVTLMGDAFDARMALGTGVALVGVLTVALNDSHAAALATTFRRLWR